MQSWNKLAQKSICVKWLDFPIHNLIKYVYTLNGFKACTGLEEILWVVGVKFASNDT